MKTIQVTKEQLENILQQIVVAKEKINKPADALKNIEAAREILSTILPLGTKY